MQDNYIEKMAKEYAEMLKLHNKKSTKSFKIPSEEREAFLKATIAQLGIIKYLRSIAKTPVKNRLLSTIESQLLTCINTPVSIKKHPFKSAENAVSFLINKELDKLEYLEHFDIDEEMSAKKYFVLTLISLLTF